MMSSHGTHNSNTADRSFRGQTPRDAFAAVRAALGDDAIVVETRQERDGIVVVARPGKVEAHVAAPARERRSFSLAPPLSIPAAAPLAHAASTSTASPLPRAPVVRPVDLADGVPALAEQLIDRGIAEHIAKRVAERCARLPGVLSVRDALPTVLAELAEPASTPWSRGNRRRVIALVGPTGVGKTTTIAKTAAHALLEEKLEVGLITLDTWRIGAVEHIKRYGEIMDVPTAVASDPASLATALARMNSRDLVLIDTAGRSPLETASFDDQMRTLATCADVEIHLAVAASSSVRQLRAVRERYTGVSGVRLVITKVDEADGPGSPLNAAAIIGRPIAAVTDGQRVPEDIHGFDIGRLCAQVLA